MIFKPQMRMKALKHPSLWFAFACLTVFSLVACGSSGGSGPSPTATVPAMPKASPTAFRVTNIDMAVRGGASLWDIFDCDLYGNLPCGSQ
jgi:hypothetical protein